MLPRTLFGVHEEISPTPAAEVRTLHTKPITTCRGSLPFSGGPDIQPDPGAAARSDPQMPQAHLPTTKSWRCQHHSSIPNVNTVEELRARLASPLMRDVGCSMPSPAISRDDANFLPRQRLSGRTRPRVSARPGGNAIDWGWRAAFSRLEAGKKRVTKLSCWPSLRDGGGYAALRTPSLKDKEPIRTRWYNEVTLIEAMQTAGGWWKTGALRDRLTNQGHWHTLYQGLDYSRLKTQEFPDDPGGKNFVPTDRGLSLFAFVQPLTRRLVDPRASQPGAARCLLDDVLVRSAEKRVLDRGRLRRRSANYRRLTFCVGSHC